MARQGLDSGVALMQDVKASCDQVALALAERGGQALVVWQSLLQRGVVEDEAGTQAMYSLNKQIDKTMVGDRGLWRPRPADMLVGKKADCCVRDKPELSGGSFVEGCKRSGEAMASLDTTLTRPWCIGLTMASMPRWTLLPEQALGC